MENRAVQRGRRRGLLPTPSCCRRTAALILAVIQALTLLRPANGWLPRHLLPSAPLRSRQVGPHTLPVLKSPGGSRRGSLTGG